ncbi:MAG: BREX-3 system phosphatase PglZ [Desulfobacterales bacterium]|nr:BREX-3 system phosphatase PglZ [Desulfobacterales bacterium]
MAGWREKILQHFTPQLSKLTLAADPDGVLLEEGILAGIRAKGFELLPFDDHIAFRYAYESKYRAKWDRGDSTELVVVLRSQSHELSHLPFDIFQAGRKLSFCLTDLFPHLSYPILRSLDLSYLDALDGALEKHPQPNLGDKASCDFILRHVFYMAPEIINNPSELLHILVRKHYQRLIIPGCLEDRFLEVLSLNKTFKDWPLEQIVPKRELFFSFLQERWPIYLERLMAPDAKEIKMPLEKYGLEFSGPADLPFGHDDIRVYMDNLFLEGMLKPVVFSMPEKLAQKWVSVGIVFNEKTWEKDHLKKLIRSIESSVPEERSFYHEWISFALKWANLETVSNASGKADILDDLSEQCGALRETVDKAFLQWLFCRYAGLYNQPPNPPVMLHHIPGFLANQVNNAPEKKIAFILVDGLSMGQWFTLRNVLQSQIGSIRIAENGVFAWVPTITSVSRQAAFSGKIPMYFGSSINTTDKEPKLWEQFWLDNGMRANRVGFLKNLGTNESFKMVEELIDRPSLKVVALVISTVDKIMHGMQLGAAGMHSQVRQWGEEGFLERLICLLAANKFDIFLSSDHGNVEATGFGSPKEGALAATKGERVRIYSDDILRALVFDQYPESIKWPQTGLPENYFPLLAPDRRAFIAENKRTVTHGGISIEEVIVPFVQISIKS